VQHTRKAKNSDLKEIVIPLNKVLKETLSRIEKKGGYVFINPTTRNPYQYRSKLMKGLCKKAKVTPFGFHAFRHFGASLLDHKGVALSTIQKLLGHSRPSTTDLYIQSLRGSTIEALKELEGLK
jgi:integrase